MFTIKKRIFKSGFKTLLALLCMMSTLLIPTMTAYAVGGAEVTLTVSQTFVNHGEATPPSEVFNYRLTPRTPAIPMPIGSNAEGYTFTMRGNQERNIGPITFNTVGIFSYELRNITTSTNDDFTIDQRVYTIAVHVTEDFKVAVTVKLCDDTKVPDILFEHSYQPPTPTPSPTPPPTPSPTPSPTPPPTLSPSPIQPGKPGDGPKTGDFSNPILWIALITGSVTVLAFIIFISRKSLKRSQRDTK